MPRYSYTAFFHVGYVQGTCLITAANKAEAIEKYKIGDIDDYETDACFEADDPTEDDLDEIEETDQ